MALEDYKAYSKVISKLQNAVKNNRLAHAYIFEGDRPSDKEGFAKEFAKAILCMDKPGIGCDNCRNCKTIENGSYRDVYYFGSDESSVKDKDIEELQGRMGSLPMEPGNRNIAIVQDADLMTRRAQNRLLKLLEEPYEGSVIILLSENSESLLPTVRSRCQKFRLYGEGLEEDGKEPYRDLARSIINGLGRDYLFQDLRNELKPISDKKEALAFLDAFEKEMRDVFIGKSKLGFSRERAKESIAYIEEARKSISYNIIARNALSKMLLEIRSK